MDVSEYLRKSSKKKDLCWPMVLVTWPTCFGPVMHCCGGIISRHKKKHEEGADLKSSFKGTYHLPKPPPTPDSTSGCWPLACALGWAWET